MFNINEARRIVHRVHHRQWTKGLRAAIVPITAHVGSVATIFTVYFFRTGSFAFNVAAWADWVVSAVLALIVVSGCYITMRELRRGGSLAVDREQLTNFLAIARFDADVSAETLAGDLSWLEEELPALRAIKESRPSLRISVFYDRARVPVALLPTIREMEKSGIELIPYPEGGAAQVRCLVVDRGSRDGSRLYFYVRDHTQAGGLARQRHLFEWQELRPTQSVLVEAVSSHIALLLTAPRPTVRIGISGLNNVGKTTLAKKLQESLRQRYAVDLIPDQFRTAGGGTGVNDNIRVLFKQLTAESTSKADICIFDRTLIDNLCFLRARTRADESLYQSLAPVIASIASSLDLTIDVQTPAALTVVKTRHVSVADRRFVRKSLDDFFADHQIRRLTVEIDPNEFDLSMDRAITAVTEQIERIMHARKIAAL